MIYIKRLFQQFDLKKAFIYFFAMLLLATSVTLIQSTNLGMSAWDALNRNFYEGIPIEYKWLTPISAILFVSLAYLITWKKPNIIMLFPILISFIIGVMIDILLTFVPVVSDSFLLLNLLYLTIATVLVAIGLNLINLCNYPLPALDQFCMSIAKFFKLSFGQGKIIGEVIALIATVVVGLIFGSQKEFFYLGFTTIFFILFLGFVIDFFRNPVYRFLKGIPHLSIYADDLTETDVNLTNIRKASRVIIVDHGKILLEYMSKGEFYMLPGGGIHPKESYEQCAKREVLEETGYKISVHEEKVIITEYFPESTFENHYFVAKLKRRNQLVHKTNQTEAEKSGKIELVWLTPDEAMNILNEQDSSHPLGTQIMWREFLGIMNSL